jgi:hypothetical protein
MSERLDFSGRARRRVRRARVAIAAWAMSTLGTLAGFPSGAELLHPAGAEAAEAEVSAAATSTLVVERSDSKESHQRRRSPPHQTVAVSTGPVLRRDVLHRDWRTRRRAEGRRLQLAGGVRFELLGRRAQREPERRAERARGRAGAQRRGPDERPGGKARPGRKAERRGEPGRKARRRAEWGKRRVRRQERRARAEPRTIPEIIYAAATEFGLNRRYLVSVAYCESDLDPLAVNPAGYYGLFQFDQPTWAAFGYGSIWNPIAQSRTAARMLAAGMYERWPNCS